ncbi:MAG TPA: hypothetical protein PKC67_09040 [Kiritimatiellia bacterium]|nr:hypothetical protein [Kiritimatiellia bacterium]HMP34485.1 hypothetical protein [Kiritimatiellia bacterium]
MNNRAGHIIFKLFVLTVIVFTLVGGIYHVLMQVTKTVQCAEQLTRIYQALELFELDRGALPKLAFYPDDPMTDPDSIRVVLEEYGVDPSAWICPASHPAIANLGLSYIWNTRLNGANLRSFTDRQWVLIEINALSPDVPAPHLGTYNVLYSDGTVERIRDPANTLKGF